ncbi:MAG TPA: energy transducer TonB, partial [Steroidobacteraceae bacterium]
LWLAVAVAAAKLENTSGAFGPFRADFRESIAAVLQVHNIYLGLCHAGTLAPCGKETIYWSLSLEEQFYVLFPLLLYFVGPARLRWILGAAILIQFPLHREAPEMLWLTRTDSISYGVLIAIAAARGDLQAVQAAVARHPVWARWLGVLLVAAVAGLSLVPQVRIEVGLIALASAGLVLLASGDRGVIIPRSNALRAVFLWTGSRSFGIYLVHHLCFWATREIFYRLYHGAHFDNSVTLGLTGLGLTVLTAEVSYRLLETPIREYGHRLASVYTQKTDRTGSAMKTIGTVARGLWPVLALLVCTRAFADLPSAETAYTQGDFTKAFHDFRELAQIGSPIAQLNLAILYARGEGTRQSDIYAYAWASLAADNGSEKAKALADRLRPELAPGSEKIATDIRNEFGSAELDARLNPKIVENAEQEDRSRCNHNHKVYFPQYPPEADSHGVQGAVYAEFSVMPDGRVRNPRIIYALPTGYFEAAVRQSLLRSEYTVAAPGSGPIQCTQFYNFVSRRNTASQYPQLQSLVKETLSKAERGDPSAQMVYGMLLVGLPQLNAPRSKAIPWFLKAAQGGIPSAQYQIGFSLLKGWGCDCEENKGLDWLRRAAQSGQPDAEVTLAMYALKGQPDEERCRQAKLWLEQAAASGSHDGKLYLSALLATTPAADGGDPKRAISLIDDVFKGVKDDPTAYEIRAAALANMGDYVGAMASEHQAIKKAEWLRWDLTPLNERMAAYKALQPWTGTLLTF